MVKASRLGIGVLTSGVLLLLALCLLFFIGVPKIVDNLISEETQLVEGSATWEKWKDIPLPIYLSFYFFHIKNPSAIDDLVPFELEEKGPYVYVQERHKEILLQDEEEDSVTYKEYTTFRFVRDLSIGDDTDVVSILNVPYVTFAALLRKYLGPMIANLVVTYMTDVLKEAMVMENVRVKDVIFDGVPTNQFYDTVITLGTAAGLFPDGPPAEFSEGSFAFYKGKNGTTTDFYKVGRGIKDKDTFGEVLEFRGRPELDWYTNQSYPIWEDQYCNMLNGSDGTVFPPFFTRDRRMYIFLIDICRSVYLTYDEDVTYRNIDAYKFVIPTEVFENPYINEDNMCFCVNPGDMFFNSCNYTGIMRIFPCKSDAPIIISKPHFLDASQIFTDMINGLNASREAHDTFVEVEPRSGQLLRVYKRLMISMQVDRLQGVTAFKDVPLPAYLVPLFWAEEYGELDDALFEDLESRLIKPLKIITIVQWVTIALAACTTVAGAVLLVKRRKKSEN